MLVVAGDNIQQFGGTYPWIVAVAASVRVVLASRTLASVVVVSVSPVNVSLVREGLVTKAATEVLTKLARFSTQPSVESGRREGFPPPRINFPTTTQTLKTNDVVKPTAALCGNKEDVLDHHNMLS